MDDLIRTLRTPRGQLRLLLVTFVGAMVLAIVMATNRWFFERYVGEKYPEPSAATTALAERVQRGDAIAVDVRALGPSGQADLYHLWMRAEDTAPLTKLPEMMFEANAAYYVERLWRTFAAGNVEQRMRAVRLAELSRHASAVPVLRWANERATATRDEAWQQAVERALRAVGVSDTKAKGGS